MKTLIVLTMLIAATAVLAADDDAAAWGLPRGLQLSAMINGHQLTATVKCVGVARRFWIGVDSHERHFDPLHLLVVGPDDVVREFGFMDTRTCCRPVETNLAANSTYTYDIDLAYWNAKLARYNTPKLFTFDPDREYRVIVVYDSCDDSWDEDPGRFRVYSRVLTLKLTAEDMEIANKALQTFCVRR